MSTLGLRQQLTEALDEPDENGRLIVSLLADLPEGFLEDIGEGRARRYEPHLPVVVGPDALGHAAPHDLGERDGEPVDHRHGGEGIADARRQRPERHLDELADRGLEILDRRPLAAELQASFELVAHAGRGRVRWCDPGKRAALDDVAAGLEGQLDDGIR